MRLLFRFVTISNQESVSSLIFRFLMTVLVNFRLFAFLMDVTAAFLNSKPKFDNYVQLPDVFFTVNPHMHSFYKTYMSSQMPLAAGMTINMIF